MHLAVMQSLPRLNVLKQLSEKVLTAQHCLTAARYLSRLLGSVGIGGLHSITPQMPPTNLLSSKPCHCEGAASFPMHALEYVNLQPKHLLPLPRVGLG